MVKKNLFLATKHNVKRAWSRSSPRTLKLRISNPHMASNNILDQLRQGEGKKIVLEKRRLSQKRISEASPNQLNASSKVATSKSIL